MSRDRYTIVVTAIGSLVGQAVLDCLEGRRASVRIVGCNSQTDSANNFRCDRSYLVPPTADPQFEPTLHDICAREAADLVVPGRDADVVRLTEIAERAPWLRGKVLGGSSLAAQVMQDKARTAEFCQRHGLPFADTVATGTPDADTAAAALVARHGFPLVAKPRNGNSSLGVRVLVTEAHLRAALSRRELVIQPFLDPPALPPLAHEEGLPLFWEIPETRLHGVQLLLRRNGEIGGMCAFRATMVRGRCERLERVHDPALLELAAGFGAVMAAEGWRGPLNVQAKRDREGAWRAIELNGRFSGGTSARRLVGFDEVALTLNEWAGREVAPLHGPRSGAVVAREFADRVFDGVAAQELERSSVWTSS
jgi:hypothetical protein